MPEYEVMREKAGVKLTVSEDGKRVFIVGTWDGQTGKSKKGNMNMSWHDKEMFDEVLLKYQNGVEEVDEPGEGAPF